MTDHRLTLQRIEPVTHDVHHLVFDRPEGFDFTPGQAVDMRLDRDGWRDEARPFTMISFPGDDRLEFCIKSYPEHDGVTEQIGRMRPGDSVLVGDPWGAIEDKGPGVFIAGGAGITPFIPIIRRRARDGDEISACTLIFSNKREADIILREEWEATEGLSTIFLLTDESAEGLPQRRVDKAFLSDCLRATEQHFYICGPDQMVEDVTAALKALGVRDAMIVTEDL